MQIYVCIGMFFRPSGVQTLDVLACYDVGIRDFLDVAEGIIKVLEILVKVFLFGCADVNVIVIREPIFLRVVSFKIDLTPRFLADEVRGKRVILGADEIPCLVYRVPCAFKTETDTVFLSFQFIPPEGVSKQAHPLFISDTVRQFVYAAISRIGDFKNSQFIP